MKENKDKKLTELAECASMTEECLSRFPLYKHNFPSETLRKVGCAGRVDRLVACSCTMCEVRSQFDFRRKPTRRDSF